MPKKSSTTARGGAQRNRPRVQKNVELVRPRQVSEATEPEVDTSAESTNGSVSAVATSDTQIESSSVTTTEPDTTTPPRKKELVAKEPVAKLETSESTTDVASTAPKGSASARLAARRQSMQKAQQRNAPTLITAEHYAYVRRDLVFIAILASIMFLTIIILHFVPGIGS